MQVSLWSKCWLSWAARGAGGNTYKLTKLVEARMKTLGDVEFDYLFLTDTNLGTCRGCRVCFEVGEDRCPAQDDRAIIADKIQSADGVIVATPSMWEMFPGS